MTKYTVRYGGSPDELSNGARRLEPYNLFVTPAIKESTRVRLALALSIVHHFAEFAVNNECGVTTTIQVSPAADNAPLPLPQEVVNTVCAEVGHFKLAFREPS